MNHRLLVACAALAAIVLLAAGWDVAMPLLRGGVAAAAPELAAVVPPGSGEALPPLTFVPPVTGADAPRAGQAVRAPELVSASPQVRAPAIPGVPDRKRLYMGNYFPWYEAETLDGTLTSDRPIVPYFNEDELVLKRHIDEAMAAGLDGFFSTWIIAKDRTDRNLGRLLSLANGRDFRLAVSYLSNALPDPTQASMVGDLRYLLANYGSHPNYLRHEGKPVVMFNNMTRVPMANGRICQTRAQCIQAWKEIRDQVEPQYPAFWMGEGLDFQYLEMFDGIYLIKVTHATTPNDFVKSPAWGRSVRAAAQTLGKPKLWMATVMPGWDDTKTAGAGFDLREAAPVFRVNRDNAGFFARTWESALQSQPDWVLLNSFNEWAEGTQIEPSPSYGNRYLEVSREWAQRFRTP